MQTQSSGTSSSTKKLTWQRCTLLLASTGMFTTAHAQTDEKYFEIGSIKVESRDVLIDGKEVCTNCVIEEYSLKDWNLKQELNQARRDDLLKDFGMSGGQSGDLSFEQIINYGVKLWKLIEAGKPVVKFQGVNANALPSTAAGDWLALENWQSPKGRIYSITYKNLYGMEVVRFDYRLLFSAGGSFEGNGKYISNVSVNAQNLWVAWGYDVDASAKVVNVINTASKANPVAGMEVLVDWRVKTVLRDMQSSTSFFLKGDGALMDLNGPAK